MSEVNDGEATERRGARPSPDAGDPREDLVGIAASLRAYLEWHIDCGSSGIPRRPREARGPAEARPAVSEVRGEAAADSPKGRSSEVRGEAAADSPKARSSEGRPTVRVIVP